MSKEERDFAEGSAANRPYEASAVELEFARAFHEYVPPLYLSFENTEGLPDRLDNEKRRALGGEALGVPKPIPVLPPVTTAMLSSTCLFISVFCSVCGLLCL